MKSNAQLANKLVVLGFCALMVFALIGYAEYVESGKEKTRQGTVGTLSVFIVPHSNSAGTETVEITFDSPGVLNLTGWEISDGEGFSHTIDADPISQGQTATICGQDVAGYGCDDVWGETDALADGDGSFYLTNPDGTVVSSIENYPAKGVGGEHGDTPAYIATIFDKNASVEFCRTDNQGGYTMHQGNVGTIVSGKSHASPDSGSIIPAFYYDSGNGPRYYSGLAWPDSTGIYSDGCVQ